MDIALHPRIINIEPYLPKLKGLFQRPELSLAYLYGSYARGQAWTYSDVDIAVLFAEDIEAEDYLDYLLRYIGEVADILGFENVDVKELNGAPVEFQYQVIKGGQALYVREEEERMHFEAEVMIEYLDFKPILDEYYHHLAKRIKERRFSARLPRYMAEVRATLGRS